MNNNNIYPNAPSAPDFNQISGTSGTTATIQTNISSGNVQTNVQMNTIFTIQPVSNTGMSSGNVSTQMPLISTGMNSGNVSTQMPLISNVNTNMPLMLNGKFIHLKSVASQKCLRVHPNGKVINGEGGTGKFATWTKFLRIGPMGGLNIGKGGKFCDFIIIHHKDGTISLKSALKKKWHVGILPNGKPKAANKTGMGKHGRFEMAIVKIPSMPQKVKTIVTKVIQFIKPKTFVRLQSVASGKMLRIMMNGSVV